jgi:hypothetical protein
MKRKKKKIHTESSSDQSSGKVNKSSFFVGMLSINFRTACRFSSWT